ncbi:MAG TPA: PIN domain-containing protein [Candidatus Limnocylindrales bacterium]
MTARLFVDTNVWVCAVDDGEPAKQALARLVIAPAPEKDIVVSAQVLGEFFVTVRRRFAQALPERDAIALVDRMRRLPVVAIDGELVRMAIANADAWQLSYWDALIVAAAETSGCAAVLSEDLSHGRTYGSVRVENPFIDLAGSA